MEESAPKAPTEDILTPQDSLESTNSMSVTPTQGTSLEGSAQVPQQTAAPAPTAAVSPEVPEVAPQKRFAGIMQNKLFRKVGLTSAILIGFIFLLAGGVAVYQKTHAPQLSETDKLAKIKDQSIQLSGGAAGGPSSLRVGVATMYVNGDISLQGILRVSNGANYGQFDGTGVTGAQTYKLPSASGTICLDSGNCNFVTVAQLAALGVDVAAVSAAAGSQVQSSGNSGVQNINGMVGVINIQGTANQVIISQANGTVTLALPQDIATTSSPTFGGLTLNGTATQNGYQLCDDSNNCGFARGDMAILQGGNAYNTEIIVGAYDNYGLSFITNNTERINITNNGLITLGGATTDRLSVLAEIAGSNALVFQGATDNFFRTTLVVTDPTANRNIILPNADGTICLTSGNCSGAGGYGDILNGGNTFNAAIVLGTNDNYGLSLKTFNTTRFNITNTGQISLLGDTAINANVTLGASSSSRITAVGQILGGTPLIFQGATDDSFTTSFVISDPTANRTIVFPNADGTVCLTSGNCAGTGGSGDILQGGNNFTATMAIGTNDNFNLELKTANATRLTISNTGNATFSADVLVNGNSTLGSDSSDRVTVNGQILGGIPFVFQGATDNAFATFFTVADPTSNRNIILPNADGTICLSSGNCTTSGGAGDVNNGGNSYNSNMSLGTNDNFGLTFKTNNTSRITISNIGLTTVLANFVVNGDTFLGASSANALTLQGSDLFAPNNLNIDTYTQYIDTLNDTVGFGVIPGAGSRVSILSKNGGDALTVSNGNGSGNILNLQDNGVNVVTVANSGYTTFKNTIDNVAAFQIQNAVGNTLLNADTTTRTIGINGGPSTYSFTASGDLLINRTEYNTGTNTAGAVASADFNGDGWLDVVSTNGATNSMSVFINNGNGTFAAKVDYTTGGSPRGVATGDVNNDGRPDIMVANSHNFTVSVSVFINNGNGTFAAKVDYNVAPSNTTVEGVATGDFNGDGWLDFVASSGTNVAVLMNNGNGTFATRVDYPAGGAIRGVTTADFNGDGHPDIAGIRGSGNLVSILMNNGNGTFAAGVYYSIQSNSIGLVTGDLNGDARPDLVVQGNGMASVLINNGNGTFAAKVDYTVGTGVTTVQNTAIADMNGDTYNDIIASSTTTGTVSILINNGNGTFAAQIQYTAGNMPVSVATGDFNGDGKPDVAVTNQTVNKLSIMFGNGGTTTISNSLSVLPPTVNHTGIYVRSNVGQLADLIRVADANGSNTMFSIGPDGQALFKNATNSTSAFQLQTAAGSTSLNFDSSNDRITLYNTGSTNMGNFAQTNPMAAGKHAHGSVAYNGYLYSVGGSSTAVYYSPISGGAATSWAATTSLPVNTYLSSVVVHNGYLYSIGGTTSGTNSAITTVYYAAINGDGTIGAWNTTTVLPAARYNHSSVILNGYVYVMGGMDDSGNTAASVYYAPLNVDGTVGAWSSTTALPQAIRASRAVVNNGYIYFMGGSNSSNATVSTVYYAAPAVDGSIASWITSGITLPYAMMSQGLFSYNGSIYSVGGCTGALAAGSGCPTSTAAFADVYSVAPNVNGSLNAWQKSTTSSILGGRAMFGIAVSGGYAYLTSGVFPGGTTTATVWSAALPGSNSGTTFNSTSATFNTTLNVQNADSTYLMIANPGNNTLTVGATTTFKNITNSTSAFRVQNAAGTNILNIDTTNSAISVANAPSTYTYTNPGPIMGTPSTYTVSGTGNYATAAADFDGDGDMDLATASNTTGLTSILMNNGSGTFAAKVDYATGTESREIAAADINGDSRPDLAIVNRSLNQVSVLTNSGTGTFGAATTYATGTAPTGVTFADLNGDNRADIITANETGNSISVLMNNGNGSFAAKVDYAKNGAVSVVAADFDGDGDQDVAVVGSTLLTGVSVFMNNGSGVLGSPATYLTNNGQRIGIAASDFNGDSRPDLVVVNGSLEVHLNNGDGTFGAASSLAAYSTTSAVQTGDVNGDGKSDIAVTAHANNQLGVYLGNGNGTFALKVDHTVQSVPRRLAMADLNNDGKSDVAIPYSNTSFVSIYLAVGGVTTVRSNLSVASSQSSNTALYVKGITGQTADLLRVEDGNNTQVMGIAASGAILFKNGANSTTAFQIQNYAGTNILQADTTNSRVYIGNATADATGALLVLDTKNTTGDPTGVDGSMYYNSFTGKFRCYEAGAWANCVGGGSAGAIVQDGNSFTAPITIGTNDAYALNLETSGVTVATLSASGEALFKNASDSLTGFQIQNAAGSNLLTAVTSLNIIAIGGTPSATPTLLVLADGNDVSDPTGYAGAMYYNSVNNRFRCYENGSWKNCITSGGGGGGGDILNGGNSGLGNMIIGNLDAGMLDLITSNQVRLRIGAAGNVAIKSTGTIGTVESFRVNTPTTVDNTASSILSTGGAANKGLVIQGAASQTANLQEWQDSTGALRATLGAAGEFRIYDGLGNATRFVSAVNGGLTVSTTSASGVVSINPDGALNLGTGSTGGIVMGRSAGDGTLTIRAATTMTASSSTVVLTVRGVSAQTANLQEWQSNGGVILGGVTAAGRLFLGQPSGSANPSTGVAQFYNSSGTGVINLQANNPGATTYTLNLPAENGTLCSTGSVCSGYAAAATNGYIELAPAGAQTDATTNSSIFINKTGVSGNIVQLQKGATNVFVVSNTGAVLVQNTANSTTAFQVQNAAGTSNALVVDTTNTRVGIGTNAPAAALEVNGNILYTQGANRTLSVAAATTVDSSGYSLTIQGGTANGSGTGGALNLNGGAVGGNSNISGSVNIATSGAFGQSGSINLTTSNAGVAAGSINLQTGANTGSAYAAINIAASGGRVNIGPANNSAKLSIVNNTASASDNVLLVLGATGQTGALQAWVSATNGVVGVVGDNGAAGFASIYQSGNQVCDTTKNCAYSLQDAYNDSTNAEIVLGSAATAGLTIRDNATPIAGNLFEVQDNAGTVTYFKADTNGIDIPTGSLKVGGTDRINNSGTLLNVTYNGNTIGTGYGGTGGTSFTANGILFGNGSGALQATAAGSSGQCLVATTGSAPTWGSCAAAASGNVNQGGNSFGQGMTVGTIDNYGLTLLVDNHAALVFDDEARATFRNKSDATTAFQVQNAAGTSLFNIDSTNSRIYVGNATPDSIGTLLVLDTKNTSGDPTGVDGAMYYNSNLGKFRCYEGSEWKDCIYNTRLATKSSDQAFSATSYADVSGLSFNVVANSVYRLSCTLLVSVPSGTNGGNVSMTGPASPTQYTATFLKSLDQSSGDNYATSTSYDDASGATTFRVNTVSTGSNRFIVNYNAVLVNGANAGTWQLRAKAVDGSSGITFYANSSCNMQPL